MGNLSHVLRRSDTSIAVSRLPHYVTGGVESCGFLLRRNYFSIETSGRNLARYQWRWLHLAPALSL